MTRLATKAALVCFVLLSAPISSSWAKDRACDRCGGHQGVHRVCRPVVIVRYEETDCWDYETEDFCVPRKCKHCCGRCGHAATSESAIENVDCPCLSGTCSHAGCGYGAVPVSRNRLLKKTYVTRIPVTVWVVEYVCQQCACREESAGGTSDQKPAGDQPRDEDPIGEKPPTPKRLAEDPFVDDPSINIRPAGDDPPAVHDEIQIPPAPVIPAPPR